jgi:hypothetical protein
VSDAPLDPWLAEELERALEPFRARLSPADLTWMREQLLDRIRTEPEAARLFERARPRDVDRSGEVARPGAEPAEAVDGRPAKSGARGG